MKKRQIIVIIALVTTSYFIGMIAPVIPHDALYDCDTLVDTVIVRDTIRIEADRTIERLLREKRNLIDRWDSIDDSIRLITRETTDEKD
jgi:hypothetical protein